jgi:LysM repeat protein
MDDDEKDECFRKYPSVLDSYDDHGLFLRSRPRYASLFDLDITDYKAWAHGLKKAGYATNPRYAELLIKIIEEHDLNQYDKGGVRMPVVPTDGKTSPNQPINKKPEEPKHQASEKPAPKPQKGTTYNGVPYVRAKKGDTWYSLAVENEMRLWQVLKYNDAEKNDLLKEGEIVYLKPKRGRPESEFHQVVAGETLREIAQEHGVKLDHLIRLNGLENDIKVQPGQQIRLRR